MLRRSLGDPLCGSNIGVVHLVNELKWLNEGVRWLLTHLGCESQGTQRLVHVDGQGGKVQHHQGF